MKYTLNCDREGDGRYLAEVPELPGVLAYGKTSDEASSKAMALALRVLADQLDLSGAKANNISFELVDGADAAEQSEFIRRGMAEIERSVAAGDGIPAEIVLAKLDAKLAAARKKKGQ